MYGFSDKESENTLKIIGGLVLVGIGAIGYVGYRIIKYCCDRMVAVPNAGHIVAVDELHGNIQHEAYDEVELQGNVDN